jgi:hypothetical protein
MIIFIIIFMITIIYDNIYARLSPPWGLLVDQSPQMRMYLLTESAVLTRGKGQLWGEGGEGLKLFGALTCRKPQSTTFV